MAKNRQNDDRDMTNTFPDEEAKLTDKEMWIKWKCFEFRRDKSDENENFQRIISYQMKINWKMFSEEIEKFLFYFILLSENKWEFILALVGDEMNKWTFRVTILKRTKIAMKKESLDVPCLHVLNAFIEHSAFLRRLDLLHVDCHFFFLSFFLLCLFSFSSSEK